MMNKFVMLRFSHQIDFMVQHLALNSELGILIDEQWILKGLAQNMLEENDISSVVIEGKKGKELVRETRDIPVVVLSANALQSNIKLSKELSKRDTGQTLYILDEPTTGLHFEDVRVLLDVLHRLVEMGNTVVVIEHNLHVVKTADWVIDLGPEGGADGGRIVIEGTPEEVAAEQQSYTGQHLAPLLERA